MAAFGSLGWDLSSPAPLRAALLSSPHSDDVPCWLHVLTGRRVFALLALVFVFVFVLVLALMEVEVAVAVAVVVEVVVVIALALTVWVVALAPIEKSS